MHKCTQKRAHNAHTSRNTPRRLLDSGIGFDGTPKKAGHGRRTRPCHPCPPLSGDFESSSTDQIVGPHRPHIHPNNYLSGAYYLKTGAGADVIRFHDPRMQAGMIVPPARDQNRANPDMVSLDVRPGMLVMFPAWLQHSVPPNLSDEDRVSVALIPHTLAVTTLGSRAIGDRVNVETDGTARATTANFTRYVT